MRRLVVASLATALLVAACSNEQASDTVIESPDPTEAPSTEATTEPATDEPSSEALPTEETPAAVEPTETESPVEPGTEADLTLTATLTGAAEVPGPGDPQGGGTFTGGIVMNEAAGELCYQLAVEGLSSAVTAAHIHTGGEDEAGDVLVELSAPLGGPVDECITLNASEIVPLLEDPTGHYVNVHTEQHPDGAVRGQVAEG